MENNSMQTDNTIDYEEWKIIKEFPQYLISNKGEVKNSKTNYILKGGIDRDGYRQVTLCANKKQYNRRICRLVAKAFIPNPYNLPQVNHQDENKNNDYVNNLEWCTSKYNNSYGSHKYNRCTPIRCVETNVIYYGIKEASRQTGIPHSTLTHACRKHCLSHNYHWEFVKGDKYV